MTRPNEAASPSNNDNFTIFKGEMDGHPLFATIDTSLRNYQNKTNFPWFLGISTPLAKPNSDGLTTRQEAEELNKWEDELERQIGSETPLVYVGRVTWSGHRELLFYVAKPDPAKRKLQSLIDGHKTRPFAFRCDKDETWSNVSVYFKDRH